MKEQINKTVREIQEVTQFLKNRVEAKPKLAIVLGSGLGQFVNEIKDQKAVPYSEIPYFHETQVEGHSGKLIFGTIRDIPIVAMQGRWHFYEGHSMSSIVLPTRVLCMLGVQHIILSNAAGGLNTKFKQGDLMIIEDHINFMGDNPLTGNESIQFGPRFPDMSEPYCQKAIAILESVSKKHGISLQKGVYASMRGPTYETPAEVRMLQAMGADAVGMSTVPEAIAARHLGVRVSGISCITNMGTGIQKEPLHHEEVQKIARQVISRLSKVLLDSIPLILKKESH